MQTATTTSIRVLRALLCILSVIAFVAITANLALAQSATVATDRLDYPPGDTVFITGSGFQGGLPTPSGGETVELVITHVDKDGLAAEYGPWTTEANSKGEISTIWVVPFNDSIIGSSLQLFATGLSSGITAVTGFTDTNPHVTIITDIPDTLCNVGETFQVCAKLTQDCSGNPAFVGRSIVFFIDSGGCSGSEVPLTIDSAITNASGEACVTLTVPNKTGNFNITARWRGEPKPNPCPNPGNNLCDPIDPNVNNRCKAWGVFEDCETVKLAPGACCHQPTIMCEAIDATHWKASGALPSELAPPTYFLRLDAFHDGNTGHEVTFGADSIWVEEVGSRLHIYGKSKIVEYDNDATPPSGHPVGQWWIVNVWFDLITNAGELAAIMNYNPAWKYYRLDPTTVHEMVNAADANDYADLWEYPTDGTMPFQLGWGANEKNLHFGAAGWLNFVHHKSSGTTYGTSTTHFDASDFLMDLTPVFQLCEGDEPCFEITVLDIDDDVETITSNLGPVIGGEFCLNPAVAGSYTLIVRVEDTCGLVDYDTCQFVVEGGAPPVCSLLVQPAPPICLTGAVHFVPYSSTNSDTCKLYGPGSLVAGGWQYQPIGGETVNVRIVCSNECDSCEIEFSVTYPQQGEIICSEPNDTTIFQCVPTQVSIPVGNPGGAPCVLTNGSPGTLSGGNWTYTPTGDQTVTVSFECRTECDTCTGNFVVTFKMNSAPVCGPTGTNPGPNKTACDTTVYFCDSGEVCLPYSSVDPDGNLSYCHIISGPGTLINGRWCFKATASGTYTATIECVDSCGAKCTQVLCASVIIDAVPVITCPPDLVFECDSVGGFGTPTVVDGGYAPATISATRDSTAGNCPGTYTLRIRYIATDTCGHADTCVQLVQVVDSTAPVIACPEPASYRCDSVPEFLPPTATDNCDPNPVVTQILAISTPSGICPQEYSMAIHWEARDACGNADTCVQSIFVYDSTPPVIVCPPDTTFSCSGAFPIGGGLKGVVPGAEIKSVPNPFPFGTPSATDNCDDTVSLSGAFGRIVDNDSCHFVFEVLYFAEDNCGNRDTCIQLVTIADTTDPVIVCPPLSRYECDSMPTTFDPPLATDICNSVTVSEIGRSKQDSTCAYEYTLVIVWEAKDKCGNADTCEQRVQIYDDAPPVLTIPATVTYNCDSVPAQLPQPTAVDQCDPNPVISLHDADTTVTGCTRVYSFYWIATDACGNYTEPYTQTVVVVDRTAPVIVCPDPLVYECDSVPTLDQLPKPTVTDNCDTNVTLDSYPISATDPECPQGYVLVIKWVAIDDCGNRDSCNQRVNVVDTTAPVLIDCKPLVTIACDSFYNKDAQSGLAPILPTMSDNCDLTPQIHYMYLGHGGQWPCNYYDSVAIWADDDCGNVSDTCYQRIELVDTTAPVIACPDSLIFECPIQPTLLPPPATDNCTASPNVKAIDYRVEDSTCPGSYRWVITWEASDICGHKDTCEQVIRFRDTKPPQFASCDPLRYECDSVPTEFPTPTASDLCDPSVDVTLIGVSDTTVGACPQRFFFTLYWEARDDCGNADTCEQAVYVTDETKPTVECPADTLVQCQNFSTADVVIASPWPFGAPGAKDNCDTDPGVYGFVAGSDGSQPCSFYLRVGYYAVDSCGNVSDTCFQSVHVVDTTAPQIACPDTLLFECDDDYNLDSLPKPLVTDNCDDSVTLERFMASSTAAPCVEEQHITILWVATDDCGNADSCTQVINVVDTTAPTLDKCDTLLVFECGVFGKEAESISPVVPTATDNCDPSPLVNWVYVSSSGSYPCSYQATFGIFAYDRCGNVSDTCYQTIKVIDTTDPVVACRIDTLVVECPDEIILTPPSATDNCNYPVNVIAIGDRIVDSTCVGSYLRIVTWEGTDYCNNKDTCEQFIRHRDTKPPVIECAAGGSYECDDLFEIARPSAKDLCDDSVDIREVGRRIVDSVSECSYTIVVTWEAKDDCGNADTCESRYAIYDQTAPVITCPAETLFACSSVPDSSLWGKPTATDNCDTNLTISLVSLDSSIGSCPDDKRYVLVWKATDDCNNSSTCTQEVHVRDTISPVMTCPPDTTLSCDEFTSILGAAKIGESIKGPGLHGWPFGAPTGTDNCDDSLEFLGFPSKELAYGACLIQYEITYIAYDNCGNRDTCYQIVSVVDSTPPVIFGCDTLLVYDCGAAKSAKEASLIGPLLPDSAIDNCDLSPEWGYELDTIIGVYPCVELDWKIWSIDTCGNVSDTCFQRMVFQDTVAPEITCPDTLTFECPEVPAGYPAPPAIDNCSIPTVSEIGRRVQDSTCPGDYYLIIAWEAHDACNNADTCEQVVHFRDLTRPVIVCPDSQFFECGVDTTLYAAPTATDNCDLHPRVELVSWSKDDIGACSYVLVRGWHAVDACGNYSDTCYQSILVGDTTKPVISCPSDTTLDCSEAGSILGENPKSILDSYARGTAAKGIFECWPYDFKYGTPTAVDNCDDTLSFCLSSVVRLDSNSCQTSYLLVFTAIDDCGNRSDTCGQIVRFVDTSDPVIVCASDTTIYCDRDKAACIEVKGSEPFKLGDDGFLCGFRMIDSVYDGCCDSVQLHSRLTYHLNQCPAYIKAFIWAVDCCGNVSDTCDWILNIADTLAPVITCPQNLVYQCDQVQGSWGTATAIDDCDNQAVVTLYHQDTVVTGCTQVISRTFSAKDRCNNESRCTQTITVSDTTDPVCVLPVNDTIYLCDLDTTICLPVSATDNCDQAVVCSVNDGAGQVIDGKWCYTPTGSGAVTTYIKCEDDCGNACTGSFTITFVINESPVCNVPNDTTIYLCDSSLILLGVGATDANGNWSHCILADGSLGTFVDSVPGLYRWAYMATKDETLCEIVRCYDSCGAFCEDTFCVTINITEPPVCYQTPDTIVALCNPVEVCVRFDWNDPVVKKTSDVAAPSKGGKSKLGGPKQPVPGPNQGPTDKSVLQGCQIVSGPGHLTGDFWCWTPPDFDTTVVVSIVCADTCGHSCTNEFSVKFDMNENPICSLLVELINPVCTPDTDFVPYSSTDPDGVTNCYVLGGGELVPGGWLNPNPEPGTTVTIAIVCVDTCGDSCVIDFTRTYPERVPVVCHVPENIDTVLCQPTLLSMPVSGGDSSVCTVIDGPGTVVDGYWQYAVANDTTFCVTIQCLSLCDSCSSEFCVTVAMNDAPVCQLPNDTTIFLCDTATICLPVTATDPNGNFADCIIDYGTKTPAYGTLINGVWCYFAFQEGSVTVPIYCVDSCGAFCRDSFTVTFDMNEPPVCQMPNDTTIFLCDTATICLPVTATDPNGNFSGCIIDYGTKTPAYGTLINGVWCYFAQQAGSVTVPIVCLDSCGASCRDSFTVMFEMNEPPVCNLPNDTTIYLCDTGTACLPVGATDKDGNLSGCVIGALPKLFDIGSLVDGIWCYKATGDAVITVPIVCTDSCGATCTGEFTVTFQVNEGPTITCPPDTVFGCGEVGDFGTPTVDSNGFAPWTLETYRDSTAGDCPGTYRLQILYVAVDSCGNRDSCVQTVRVVDTVPPTITCPSDTIVDCSEDMNGDDKSKSMLAGFADGSVGKDAAGCYPYDWAFGVPTATDNCDDTIDFCLVAVYPSAVDSCRLTYTLVFRGRDNCNNRSDTCTQRVIFTDTTAPVVICAADTTVYCSSPSSCFEDKSGILKLNEKYLCDYRLIDTVYDACDNDVDYYTSLFYQTASCPKYIRAKIWAVDDCGNVSDTCFWTVHLVDTTDPVITCPANINAQCGANPVDWGTPTATDDCGAPTVVLIDLDTLASSGCVLEIVRTFTATDFCGNADTCRQSIFVGDTVDPVITCPRDTLVTCDEERKTSDDPKTQLTYWSTLNPVREIASSTTTSSVPQRRPTIARTHQYALADVDLSHSDSCRTTFLLKFVARDECGNADTCTQIVSFEDKTRPVIVCAEDTTIYCDRDKAACIEVKGVEPFKIGNDGFLCGFRMIDTVYDGCCANVQLYSRLTYHLNKCPAYIKAYMWAVDCCGNVSDTCDWVLYIDDTLAPVITCPPNLNYLCDQAQGPWGSATAIDNCDNQAVVTLFSQDTVSEQSSCYKQIHRTFKAVDKCGNTNYCTQTITIGSPTAPVGPAGIDPNAKTVQAGDVDGSGQINIADLAALYQIVTRLSGKASSAGSVTTASAGYTNSADFNCDGTIDRKDLADLTAYVFSSGPQPCLKE